MQDAVTKRFSGASSADIATAGQLLRDGGVVAIPTETVYGLSSRSDLEDAVKAVYDIKQRNPARALSVLVPDFEATHALWEDGPWIEAARALAENLWPGPLTIICPATDAVSSTLRGGAAGVGLRCPGHPVAQDILREVGVPLVAPSANISEAPSPTTGDAVAAQLSGKIAGIVDTDVASGGLESTIVALTEHGAMLTRAGAIALETINASLPDAWKISARHDVSPDSSRLLPKSAAHPTSVEIYIQGTWRVHRAASVDALIQGLHGYLSSLSDGERGGAAWRAGDALREDSRFAGVCYLMDRYLRRV